MLLDADLAWEDVLRHADEALYQAKEAGRNQVVVYRHVFGTRIDGVLRAI